MSGPCETVTPVNESLLGQRQLVYGGGEGGWAPCQCPLSVCFNSRRTMHTVSVFLSIIFRRLSYAAQILESITLWGNGQMLQRAAVVTL